MKDLKKYPEVLTASEVAGILRLSTLTIKRRLRSGKLKGVRVNDRGDWRVLRSTIEEGYFNE